jgi:DNA-binding NtrC family response regulator
LKVPGRRIRLADVLSHISLDGAPSSFAIAGTLKTLKEARDQFEREYVAAVLRQHNGRMAEAATALGIQRTNLYRKVRQLSVERPAGRRS